MRGSAAIAAAGWACAAATVAGTAGAAAAPPEAMFEYKVERGDTLIGISQNLLIEPARWSALQRLNRVANPRRLQPGSVLHLPAAWIRRTGTPATLVFVRGDVHVTPAAGGAAVAATANAQVEPGDTLETAADATATLRFADGSRLLVPAGTRLRLDALEALGRARRPHTVIDLMQGEADARVTPAPGPGPRVFTIGTPAVNLGVRGTEFRARVDPASRQVHAEVTAGVVEAESTNARRAPLAAGFGIAVTEGAAGFDPVRLLPAPDLDGVAPRIERVPLRFEWPAIEGAVAYRAEVLGTEEDLLLDSQPATPAAKWVDLPDGHYRLRVRAIDARGLQGRDSDRPFVLKARPEPPLLMEPRAGARSYGTGADFRWTLAEAPRRYRLQVSSHADFNAPEIEREALAGATESVPLAPGTWWWRMAAVRDAADGDDAGPFGEPQAFEQRVTPEPPAMGVAQQEPGGLTFSWGTIPAGRHVRYQVATEPRFEHVVVDQKTTDPQGLLPKPAPGSYYIHARMVDDDDGFEGPWGASQLVQVSASLWWLVIPLGVLLWGL